MTPPELIWLRRLGDEPRIGYTPPVSIDRQRLPGHAVHPDVRRSVLDDRTLRLEWPDWKGGSGGSPASAWGREEASGEADPVALHRRLVEALELPGTPSDYHFVLQGGAEELWKHRRRNPWVWSAFEQLSWTSVRLALTFKDALRLGDEMTMPVLAFGRLITLYSREGWVREAVEVMHLSEQYAGQPAHDREALLARLRALDEESRG